MSPHSTLRAERWNTRDAKFALTRGAPLHAAREPSAMTTLAEYQAVIASMQALVDGYGLPQFTETDCDSEAREVIFTWRRERATVVVELDAGATVEQQVASAFAGAPML